MDKLKFIAIKEVRHIMRDRRSLFIAIMMPVIMTFLYGYAINLDIKNIKLAVLDYDQSSQSREFVSSFYTSGYFVRGRAEADLAQPEYVLKRGLATAVLTIPEGFSEAVETLSEFEIGMLIDGADANMASAAASYASIILGEYLRKQMPEDFEIPGIRLSQQVLYNPDLKSALFFVPGLMAIILMMISALLTSITIAREKETGTMEQLLTAPVKPHHIIIGKVIPYVALALLDGALVWALGVFHFGVPMAGSLALLLLFGVIYVIAALSIGVVISTLVKTQQVAMMLAMAITMLPSVMLSGFIFEIENMPSFLQAITYIVPARYFITIIRGIMLKGASIDVLWPQAVALIALTVVLLGIAIRKFEIKVG